MSQDNKDEGVVRVCISIPNEGHTQVEAYANRLDNFRHIGSLEEKGIQEKLTPRFEFFFVTLGRILTPKAREEAADTALDINADYLYMIDDDMICPNDMFEKLYRHNVDVVAPLAFTRNFPHHPVLYDIKEGWDPVSRSDYFINHHVVNYQRDSLIECDAVGFGAVLIKTSVLKKVATPRFMSTCGTGEDILFCHKARKAGFRVFMDTSVKLGHLSHPVNVTEEYRDKVLKELKYKDTMELSPKRESVRMRSDEALVVLGD